MSIRFKLMGGFLGILTLFAGVFLYTHLEFRRSNERLGLLNDFLLPLSRRLIQLQSNVGSLQEERRRYLIPGAGDPTQQTFGKMARDLYPYVLEKRFQAVHLLIDQYSPSLSKETRDELYALAEEVKSSLNGFNQAVSVSMLEREGGDLKEKLKRFLKRTDQECQRITQAAQREGHRSLVFSLAISLLVVLFGLAVIFFSHRVLQPLPGLIQSIKRIADGDLDQSLKVRSSDKDEISILAREYNRMLAGLRDRDAKIQSQQQELLQSERLAAVGQLSAEIVHEIRNPLNSISLNIDWLAEELRGEAPEVQKTLLSLSKEIQRLNQITESYLVRAKVPTPDTRRTDVHELIDEVVSFTKEEDQSKNIVVESEFGTQNFFLPTEKFRLKQVFLNLLKNAREAMPRGGIIRIKTEAKENIYCVHISDTGHGMNEAILRKSFHPFFTTKPEGTGLGLMLAKNIIEEAHGSLQCESSVGGGTTFTLRFPVTPSC